LTADEAKTLDLLPKLFLSVFAGASQAGFIPGGLDEPVWLQPARKQLKYKRLKGLGRRSDEEA